MELILSEMADVHSRISTLRCRALSVVCCVDFEEMCRAYTKASKVIDKEGGVPRFYLRYLAELDDFVNEVGMPSCLTCQSLLVCHMSIVPSESTHL